MWVAHVSRPSVKWVTPGFPGKTVKFSYSRSKSHEYFHKRKKKSEKE